MAWQVLAVTVLVEIAIVQVWCWHHLKRHQAI